MEEKTRCERNSSLLIVEDDESQLRIITAIMEEESFDVIGCSTASEALEHLDHLKTGVVMPDLCLPDLSGTQLLERLVDFRKTESLGMQLIIMLVEQLEGTVELDKSKGTRFKITFEKPKPKDREPIKWQV